MITVITKFELGKTYIDIEDFYSKKEFMENLRHARHVCFKSIL